MHLDLLCGHHSLIDICQDAAEGDIAVRKRGVHDIDVFLLRPCNNSLSDEQKNCLAEVNAMMGSVLFTSDNFYDYTEKEIKELSRIMQIKDAEIVSADLTDDSLTLRFIVGGKKYIKRYSM